MILLREGTRTSAISLQTFGGPAGQITVIHHQLVDRLRWLSLFGRTRFVALGPVPTELPVWSSVELVALVTGAGPGADLLASVEPATHAGRMRRRRRRGHRAGDLTSRG